MSKKKSLYEILGVKRTATDDEIKAAYRKLAVKWHPDRHATETDTKKKEAEDKFKEISEAYSVLSDKEARQQYDQFGTIGKHPNMTNGYPDIRDILRKMHAQHGFSGFGNNEYLKKGRDKQLNINLSLEEIYKGGEKNITYKVYKRCTSCEGTGSKDKQVHKCHHCDGTGVFVQQQQYGANVFVNEMKCPYCNGTGRDNTSSNTCSKCNGSGLEISERSVSIRIPTMIELQSMGAMMLAQKGMGSESEDKDSPNGDLYYRFTVTSNNKDFGVLNEWPFDLITSIDVPVLDCILGGPVQVINIDGGVLMFDIKQGTQDGEKFRIKGKGFPKPDGLRGDLYVIVNIKMPKNLTEDERKVLTELKEKESFK